jgi:hypothetical protein
VSKSPRYLEVTRLYLTFKLLGTEGIVQKIRETVGDSPVYLSIDVGLFPLP